MKKIRKIALVILATLLTVGSQAQDKAYILDRVIAVVGDFEILQSDIEQQFMQIKASQPYVSETVKCEIFNYFIEQKLMMNQAKIDSIEVSPGQVELSMESRLETFIRQIGSEKEMEEYFNKSIYDIREDLRKTMKDMMITQEVQGTITGDITTTPSEVKAFYKKLDTDSIPYIDSEVKLAQIVMYPKTSNDAIFAVKEKLLDLRKRVMDGENFATLAILYSDGPSAPMGGEIGFANRSSGMDPKYMDAAMSLKEGQVSKIIESEFGYHIIQLIERKNDMVNTRHIILKPKVDALAKTRAIEKIDSLRTFIVTDSITFDAAAMYYSQDEETNVNGGLLVNPMTSAATFEYNQLDTKDYYTIREMKVGEVSKPFETVDISQKVCYKIIKLLDRTEPHRANLKEDYLLLQNMALGAKHQAVMEDWYKEKREKTFIKIDSSFEECAQ